jgi:hypothetical protein
MQRKAANEKPITTQAECKRQEFDATMMYAALEARVEALGVQIPQVEARVEARVAALEKQVAQAQFEVKADRDDSVAPTEERVRRGPKPRFRPEHFLQWRDLLVEMLESNWPEIEPTCVPEVDETAFTSALEAIAHKGGSQHQSCAEHLLRNLGMLLKFLGTSRFRGDPRQLANALAGAPQLTFWRSLKLAQADPCELRIGQRALKAYIRRKHPGLYREFEKNIDLLHFTNVWRAYRIKDTNISDYYARAIHHVWIAN